MKTIDKRAKEYADKQVNVGTQALCRVEGYIAGATEQKAIDIKTIRGLHCDKCGFPAHCDLCETGQILKVLEEEK